MPLTHNTDTVLRNLRWKQRFSVHRTSRIPDEKGRAVVGEEVISAIGVIQPASGKDLDRLAEGDRVQGAITVWSNIMLTAGSGDELPDEVGWRGARYMVRHVNDWGDYGLGWCRAVCAEQAPKGESP